MNAPSFPLCAPLTVPSALIPTAAINAVPRRDATRALSPMTMGLPVWVSCPDKINRWIAQDQENKGSTMRKGEALRALITLVLGEGLALLTFL